MKPLTVNRQDKEGAAISNCSTQSAASSIIPPKNIQVTHVLFTLRWRLMTQILLALPVIGLFICLISSLIFHADHINNTICKVYNFLPSISAVTGVSPQRYLWRVCVALHISPRLLVAWVAREFYSSMATRVPAIHRPVYKGLVTLAFCLNITELATLCGVTYISNKENYPVHEKLFMLFMMASLVYMVCVVRLLNTVSHALSPGLLRSLNHKRWLLGTKIGATLGLLFFFWRHRMHCQPKAFSWFSLCEYIIATCNMLYHVSVALDFSEEHLIVGHIVATSPSLSVGSPETSMVSSFTMNSLNEFTNAIDKTPDSEIHLEDYTSTTRRDRRQRDDLFDIETTPLMEKDSESSSSSPTDQTVFKNDSPPANVNLEGKGSERGNKLVEILDPSDQTLYFSAIKLGNNSEESQSDLQDCFDKLKETKLTKDGMMKAPQNLTKELSEVVKTNLLHKEKEKDTLLRERVKNYNPARVTEALGPQELSAEETSASKETKDQEQKEEEESKTPPKKMGNSTGPLVANLVDAKSCSDRTRHFHSE